MVEFSGIFGDKTMDDKLITSPMMIIKFTLKLEPIKIQLSF